MKTRVLPLVAFSLLALPAAHVAAASARDVMLHQEAGRVRVEVGGKLFTEYVYKDVPKPFLYPVIFKDGTELMRHYPMKKDVPGEVSDHPHHRSLWFTHGAVNGVDFWTENGDNKGKIVNDSVDHSTAGGVATIRSRNRWVGPNGVVHLSDETTISIRTTEDGSPLLDYQVTLKAPADKPVVFGDTKEGSMAIRVPLWMTPDHSQGRGKTHEGKGTIVNDAGVKNKDAWGKKSTWVDYYAPKDGKIYGVAIMDHPSNPRHPTWWHVRDYGLFAANPFGQRDFEPDQKHEAGKGNLDIPAGGSRTFRWRFYFHEGDEKTAKVAEQYKQFAASK